MNQLILTVYDEKAMTFLPPFVVPTKGLAVRAFKDCVNSTDHQFGKHPSDYTLFHLANFDDQTAEFIIQDKVSLGNGVEFINPEHISALEEFENGPHQPPIQPD